MNNPNTPTPESEKTLRANWRTTEELIKQCWKRTDWMFEEENPVVTQEESLLVDVAHRLTKQQEDIDILNVKLTKSEEDRDSWAEESMAYSSQIDDLQSQLTQVKEELGQQKIWTERFKNLAETSKEFYEGLIEGDKELLKLLDREK